MAQAVMNFFVVEEKIWYKYNMDKSLCKFFYR